MDLVGVHEKAKALGDNLGKVIRGKAGVIDLAITALLSNGHLLIEDVPGVGKTTLAHGLAKSINCTFQRIQFTSDLLPSDVIGVTVYNQSDGSFEFRKGPIFANIILADEINRATPKTQSALLEAMSDRQVSVDKLTHPLPAPFMLLATQNPMEFSGTFPLPESQLDRFTISVEMGYPDSEHEMEIIRSKDTPILIQELDPVVTIDDLASMQELTHLVRVDEDLVGYILEIAAATRTHRGIRLGASPRAAKTLYRCAQARAAISGRSYCVPDDIKLLAVPVFAHRIIPRDRGLDEGAACARDLVKEIVSGIGVPV